MVKSFSFFIGLFLMFSNCQAQEGNTAVQSAELGDMQAMNLSERLNYIEERIKKYKKQPLYQLKVASPLHYEIRINDFPIAFKYFDSKGMIYFPVNKSILASGKQEISIKILPPSDDPQALIPKDSYFVLELYQTAWEDGSLTEPKTMLSYKLDWDKQDYSQLTQILEKNSFTAKVLYTLKRWSKGKDLRKLDQKVLEKQVVSFYEKMRALRKNLEIDIYKTYHLKANVDWYQSEYLGKNSINELEIAMEKYKNLIDITLLPFENYEMRFAANGRVVYLVFKTGKHKGESLLSYLSSDKETENESYIYINLFLSIPEGSDQLEII